MPEPSPKTPRRAILDGAYAARTLAEACEASSERKSSPKLTVVRDLARDTERHLDGLAAGGEHAALLAEAAQKCADLATLAACNAGELEDPLYASGAVRLAAEATESLSLAVEESDSKDLVRRDVRSASWKASLAVRQSLRFGEPGATR